MLKQLRAVIRLQAEISLDDKNSGTGLEEDASRAAGGWYGVQDTRTHQACFSHDGQVPSNFINFKILISLSYQCEIFFYSVSSSQDPKFRVLT